MLDELLYSIGRFFLGDARINEIAINRLVNAGPSRPYAWSTLSDDYISWTGLTDRTFFARLLPPADAPVADGRGTSRPPLAEIISLFPAEPGRQELCSKSTCLFPAFAQYLTDGFLRTQIFNTPPGVGTRPQTSDRRRTTSNHEIDMSALYGRTSEQTRALRTGEGGRLKSQRINNEEFPPFLYNDDGSLRDEFKDSDGLLILDEPLGIEGASTDRSTIFAVGGDRVNTSVQVAAVNILLLREHNRLAGLIQSSHRDWDDQRIFETSRNIVIVEFIRIVVNEYINNISSAPFRFSADPKVAWNAKWAKPNWMTIEFTLLYRWHSLVPEFINWNGKTLTADKMLRNNELLLKGGLANAFVQLSANKAARMGIGNFASFLLLAEAKGIEQGRENRLRSYNEYRRAMGLREATSFEDVVGSSGDKSRSDLDDSLRQLYGVVDNLEFYVGIFAEPVLRNSPISELVLAMVAMDAFSQALPNPLLSERIWTNEENKIRTFSSLGLKEIQSINSIRDILARNATLAPTEFVGMTQPGWVRK